MRIFEFRYWARLMLAGIVLSIPSTGWAVNCCSVDGGACNIIPPLIHGQSGWLGPICGTTLSGTNCTAILDANASASSGNCLTLGRGVTLDLNNKAITCTGSCGIAILNTDSAGSSNAVVIKNGDIKAGTGSWTEGVKVTGGSNSRVSELLVDGADVGIIGVRGPIEDTVVSNSVDGGIELFPGEDMSNVILRTNGVGTQGFGLLLTGDTSNSNLDNVLFIGNYDNVYRLNATYTASLQRSELQEAGSCNCHAVLWGVFEICDPSAAACFTITNSTTPTMIDDAMVP